MNRKFTYAGLLALSVGLVNCAHTDRTGYHPANWTGGYTDNKLDGQMRVARFAGNAYTRSDTAVRLSNFRAFEVCKEEGFEAARVFGVNDLSTSQTVTKSASSTYTAPMQYNGSSNYYGYTSHHSGTITGGNQYANTTSWNETYRYPTFDTYFKCTDHIFQTKLELKPISPEDMKPFVKDLMGALQVQNIKDDSPNHVAIQVGDLVVKVEGNRVQNLVQFVNAVDNAKDKGRIELRIIRDGKPKTVTAAAVEATSEVIKAENELIDRECSLAPELKKRPICTDSNRMPANDN